MPKLVSMVGKSTGSERCTSVMARVEYMIPVFDHMGHCGRVSAVAGDGLTYCTVTNYVI